MKFKLLPPLGLVLFATAVLPTIGCKPKEKATVVPTVPDVFVLPVAQQDVPIIREWLGTLDGSSNAEIRARVSGYLQEQKYSEGSVVKKGEVLFLIDPKPFEAALAQAKASVGQAEAQQGRSQAEFTKQKELFEKRAVSQRDYDNANFTNLANLSNVDVAKAALQQAELNLGFTTITSPVEGIAGISNVGIGDLVGPSTASLASVSTVDPIKAKFPISEQEYLKFSKGLTEVMALPLSERKARSELVLADGQVFPEKGTFFSVDRQVTVKTGTIAIEVLFPNPGNRLRPGQYAKVRSVIGTEAAALLVPQRAVTEMQGSYSVAVVADGKVEIRPVKVGERVGSLWVISQGLKAGESVVIEGLQKVRTGAPVNAKPWTPPSAPAPADAERAIEAKPEAK